MSDLDSEDSGTDGTAAGGSRRLVAAHVTGPSDSTTQRKEVSAMKNITVGRYDVEGNGYAGWIEPEDKGWILYVRDDHSVEVYLDRDPATGAIL